LKNLRYDLDAYILPVDACARNSSEPCVNGKVLVDLTKHTMHPRIIIIIIISELDKFEI